MTRRPVRLTLIPLEDRTTPAVAGSLDPSFGTNGLAKYAIPPVSMSFTPASVAVYPDGRYVVSGASVGNQNPDGSGTFLVRYTPSGQLDTTFGTDGFIKLATVIGAPTTLAIDPAGRLLYSSRILYRATTGPTDGLRIARLTANGQPDASFGSNGVATIPVSPTAASSDDVVAFAFQADGGIVVAGSETAISTAQYPPFSIAVGRFTDAGQPDAGFGTGGIAVIPFSLNGQNEASASAVAFEPDGRIVVAGGATASVTHSPYTHGTSYSSDPVVVRLTPSGQLDPTFGTGGRVSLSTPTVNDEADHLQVLPDGRLLLGGSRNYTTVPFAARLAADGSVDTTYGTNGRVDLQDSDSNASAYVLPLADGRALFVTGRSSDGPQTTVGRLAANGQPEPGFSPAADVGTIPAPSLTKPAVALPDGGVLLFGEVQTTYNQDTLSYSYDDGAIRFAGTTTLFPASVGTLALGGMPDGSVTPLLPGAGGAFTPVAPLNVYPNFPGPARTATADVNGDGVPDIVTGPGPGGGPNVVVTDGKTGAKIADLNAFEKTFTGGVFVAAADLNGDGKAEVVVTPDQGGGPVVAIYDGAGLAAGKNEAAQLTRFFGINDTAFRGGARPALGDVNGDGRPDLVVAAGVGGGPRVALYDGAAVADPSRYVQVVVGQEPLLVGGDGNNHPPQHFFNVYANLPPELLPDFFVFEPTLRNGVFVAAGDLTGDGKAELVVGGGPGGGPRVMALDGSALAGGQMTPVVNFFAGDASGRGGVRVAVRPAADGSMQLVTGSGEGQPGRVNVYKAATARAGGPADQTLSPFGDAALSDGVYVG